MTRITREQFMMGRDVEYPTSEQMEINAARLLYRVNLLLGVYLPDIKTSNWSGYRPGKYNAKYSPGSAHVSCEAIDLEDEDGAIKAYLMQHQDLLKAIGLYMEHPDATPSWCHLSTRAPKSGNHVFRP